MPAPRRWALPALVIAAFCLSACDTVEYQPLPDSQRFVPSNRELACGNWAAYAEDTSGYRVLEIRTLDPENEPDQYSVLRGSEQMLPRHGMISIYRMERKNAMNEHFCNDVVPEGRILDTLTGIGGTLDVRKYDRKPGQPLATFLLDVKLRSVEFIGSPAISLDSLRLDSLSAGWLPG